jgi:hypothetical protein
MTRRQHVSDFAFLKRDFCVFKKQIKRGGRQFFLYNNYIINNKSDKSKI